MATHTLAGQPAPVGMLIDVSELQRAYHERRPDPEDPRQRVAFGTSGHRGTPGDGKFTEAHILAITQAICDYRRYQGIDGWVLAAAAPAMAASTLLTTILHRRGFAARLAAGGRAGKCRQPVVVLGRRQLHTQGAVGRGPRLLGPVPWPLTPASSAPVFLFLPLLVVPIATGTAISAWTDLRRTASGSISERSACPSARCRPGWRTTSASAAWTDPELSSLTGAALGAFARAESVARGLQDGLNFLSLTMLGIGLPLAVLRGFTPPRQQLIPDPVSWTSADSSTRVGRLTHL